MACYIYLQASMVKYVLWYAITHVGCIINKVAAVNGTAMGNSVQWMLNFLNSRNFHFTSTLSVERKKANKNSITDACHNNTEETPRLLTDDIKQVDELKTSLQVFTASDAILTHRSESASSFLFTTVQPLSYAAIVSKSISDTIKQVVTETIKDRENNTRDKSSVILFGLANWKQDFQDVGTLLKQINVNSIPVV